MESIMLLAFGVNVGWAVYNTLASKRLQEKLAEEASKSSKVLADMADVVSVTSKSQAAIATEVEKLRVDLAGFRMTEATRRR